MNHDETHNDVTHNDAARDGASGSGPEDHAPTEGMEHRVAAAGAELLAQAARHSAAPLTLIRRAKAMRRQRLGGGWYWPLGPVGRHGMARRNATTNQRDRD